MPRPKLVPTEDQRKQVKKLSAMGVVQPEIARFVDVRSPKTLRKYFRTELNRGELEGYVKVEQTRYQMATDGKHPFVTDQWLASRARRLGKPDGASVNPPVCIVVPFDDEEKAA